MRVPSTFRLFGSPSFCRFYGHLRFAVPQFFVACLVLGLCSCEKPDNRNIDLLAKSIRSRAAAVQTLKQEGLISENGRGYLRPNPGIHLNIPERRILEEENFERSKVFLLIAKQNELPKRNVEAVFVKLSTSKPK
jgi:uncharacterized protein YdbL (DUF1318 family)